MNHTTKNMSTTPYDDVGRTLVNDCPELIIPVVNEAYHTNYQLDEPIVSRSNELFITRSDGSQEERITDTYFLIHKIPYHIEFQSTIDGTISYRLLEYDCLIAMRDHAILEGNKLSILLPNSLLIYLRSTKTTPDHMEFSIECNGESLSYRVPILKIRNYTIDEIFQKRLLFLIPFYLFNFEKDFKKINKSEAKLAELERFYVDLFIHLDEYPVDEMTSQLIKEMTLKVTEHLTYKYEKIKERMINLMRGKVLNYEAKTIYNQGKTQGISQGISQGIPQGIEMLNTLYAKLFDDGLIDIAKLVSKDAAAREKYLKLYGIK